jgi:hypothetical protein
MVLLGRIDEEAKGAEEVVPYSMHVRQVTCNSTLTLLQKHC